MNIDIPSYETIDSAYTCLYAAYMRCDRDAIILYCGKCQELGIPQFHDRANKEAEMIYAMAGIKTYQLESTLDTLPDDVLNNYDRDKALRIYHKYTDKYIVELDQLALINQSGKVVVHINDSNKNDNDIYNDLIYSLISNTFLYFNSSLLIN